MAWGHERVGPMPARQAQFLGKDAAAPAKHHRGRAEAEA